MGRWAYSDRHMVEECKTIDISMLSRNGCFHENGGILEGPGGVEVHVSPGEGVVRFHYPHGVSAETPLVHVPLRLKAGGIKYYFLCPTCGRRVWKLYLPPEAESFKCRHCHNLTYRCQKQRDKKVVALLKQPERLSALLRRGRGGEYNKGLKACLEIILRMRKQAANFANINK